MMGDTQTDCCPMCGAWRPVSGLDFDERNTMVGWKGKRARVDKSMFGLMALLASKRGVTSYMAIIDLLWGNLADGGPEDTCNGIKTRISRLRRMLLKIGAPVQIVVVRGVGYHLVVNEPTPTKRRALDQETA